MGHLIRLSFSVLSAIALTAGSAVAATTAVQLIELSKAGLSDDILIALIQTDGSIFHLTAADILALHRAGLSDKVIMAMTETARTSVRPARNDDGAAEARQPVPPSASQLAPPTVVNVTQHVTQQVDAPRQSHSIPYYSVPITVPVFPTFVRQPDPPPVYWGFGGERRPDSWDDGNANKVEKKKKSH